MTLAVLYCEENCRDYFQEDLDKEFGEGKWKLDGRNYSMYNVENLPDKIEISIVDGDEIIGLLIVENNFYVNRDDNTRWVDVQPLSGEIVRVPK